MLCASNLVVIPSRTEGFGLTALEALSAGLPFLVSQNSGFGEALQEIGPSFIVDSEDPVHWAEAIKGVDRKEVRCQLRSVDNYACGTLRNTPGSRSVTSL